MFGIRYEIRPSKISATSVRNVLRRSGRFWAGFALDAQTNLSGTTSSRKEIIRKQDSPKAIENWGTSGGAGR